MGGCHLIASDSGLRGKQKAALLCLALFAGFVPMARAGFLTEVSYNEGWNVYNAQTLVQGGRLYPAPYGWTTVNYPPLSFVLAALLHRLTHDYLFTARVVSIVSLLCCAALTATIVRRIGGTRSAAAYTGFFCWAVFCVEADYYVGADDPQLLAQAVLLAGLLVYVQGVRTYGRIAAAACIFVAGLFVKHNQIDIPVALGLDLLFVSFPLALWFVAWCGALAVVGAELTIHLEGPYFLTQLLTPRSFSWAKIPGVFIDVVGPLLITFAVCAFTAWKQRRDDRRRVVSLVLLCAVLIGGYFSGGSGVAVNALFSVMLAMALLSGLFLSDFEKERGMGTPPTVLSPVLILGWLFVPLITSGLWSPVSRMREAANSQRQFGREVEGLRAAPGPALCESLLACFEAGKPYVYDPFNATRLIQFGKLPEGDIVNKLSNRQFGAVQVNARLRSSVPGQAERFTPAIQRAIETNYTPMPDKLGKAPAGVLYVPKP